MNKEYRYKLASNKVPKLECPKCKAKKHWQRYINTQTGEVLPDEYGYCDNQVKCGYSNNPYTSGYAKTIWLLENNKSVNIVNIVNDKNKMFFHDKKKIPDKPKPVHIPYDILKQTLLGYNENTFVQNLLTNINYPFEVKDIEKAISLYYLGTITNGYRKGAITFPFIDYNNNIRSIQVKQFNNSNHTIGTDFLHSIIEKDHVKNELPLPEWLINYKKQDKFVSCLFGEHLLKRFPNNPIALVEAPKTAIYCNFYFGFPDESNDNFIFLAVYNKSSFTLDKLKILQGRYVYTFPDTSTNGITFNEWKQKATEFEKELKSTRFIFSDLLEKFAPETDKQKGYDIADYLIKTDWSKYRKVKITNTITPTENQPKIEHQTIPTTPTISEQIKQLDYLCQINPNITEFINVLGLEPIIYK